MQTISTHIPWSPRVLRSSKFVRDTMGLAAGKGLNLVLGVLSTLIFGIVFSKPEIAAISLFGMVVELVLAFGVNWSAAGVTRFGKGELLANNSLCYTSSTRLYVVVPIFAAATVLIVVFRKSVLAFLGASEPILIWYLVATLFVAVVHEQLTSLLATREKHIANALFYVSQGVAKLAILAMFFSGIVEASVLSFVAATFWLDALVLLVRLPSCGRPFLLPLCRVERKDLQRFLYYVVPQLYGFAGIYVVNWVDVYFIRKHGTLEELGAYQFLYAIFLKMAMFAFVANTVLFPRIMAWKQENPAQISRFTKSVPHVMLLIAIIGCGFLLTGFPALFSLFFDDKFVIAYPSFTLMICALPCYFISYIFVPVLNSVDRVKYIQTVNIVSAASNLVVDFLLVPRYGIIGAALGTFVAYWVKALLLMIPVNHMFGVKWQVILILHVMLAGFVAERFFAAINL